MPESNTRRDDTRPDRVAPAEPVVERGYDYIETTKPEDPSDNPGQRTRDNVNPDIPSAVPQRLREEEALRRAIPSKSQEPPGATIIPPNDGGGVEPTPNPTREEVVAERAARGDRPPESVNEPPGSVILPDNAVGEAEAFRAAKLGEVRSGVVPGTPTTPVAPGVTEDDHVDDKLPPPSELEAMTRAELDHLAEERNVDVSDAKVKQDVIDALRKDARRRKREESR